MKENKFLLIITGVISGCIQISVVIGMLVLPNILFNSESTNSFSENEITKEQSTSKYNKSQLTKFFTNRQLNKNGSSKEIVIYNGVTIDEGIQSNEDIDNKAEELTQNATSDRERARILYTWVGSNIKYDDDKANKVLYEKDIRQMPESGAINAFEGRTGICFDKACLYVAMSRAINLKVRLIGGQAFDGHQYVGHAWNQVYLNDENIWINVDSTFYDGGNYFDSNLFKNHNVEEIVGEW
ncbi:transglutaminase-like domain-containing protein [Clostridium chromiireducens]|uniref:Transglutaminase domain-containing protein n=1 Tax=Clostridium chromiireducens TaxID=225345 RepID=A0A1V4IQX4_9CLOT|nr:transglutaminase-like domain-containing protein [Clostridium chromiireducens]OPJ62204.1 transglutaminase-like superfamily protein [Clostridium chromiireducens]RII35600.1 transglutaminase domain-containing protein [Clostridium chromiireducens]